MFDKDGSGTIDFNEFASLWKYVTDWQACFRGFDRDNSGTIDGFELKNALTSFGKYAATNQNICSKSCKSVFACMHAFDGLATCR